jgi:hypothetical protein
LWREEGILITSRSYSYCLYWRKLFWKLLFKETSGCTFMCSLGVFQDFNFLIILSIFMNICTDIILLKESPNPELQFSINGNLGIVKSQILWGWNNSCTTCVRSWTNIWQEIWRKYKILVQVVYKITIWKLLKNAILL